MNIDVGRAVVTLRGRNLEIYDHDPATDREYSVAVDLTPAQTGAFIDELVSTLDVIVPGSIVGSWLQAAFDSGLDVGRNEKNEETDDGQA